LTNRAERGTNYGVVTRALWFFSLLAAFFVVGARCLVAFPVVVVAAEEQTRGTAVSPGSQAPTDQEPATGGTIDGDSDPGVDAVVAPSRVSFELAAAALVEAGRLGVLCQQPALQCHIEGLERPPRLGLTPRPI
jgi:hypothetical protein